MDAFAVSISCGANIKHSHLKNISDCRVFIRLFSGFDAAHRMDSRTDNCDVYQINRPLGNIFLMLILGLKMIFESGALKEKPNEKISLTINFCWFLSIATSLDAFAVGVSLSILQITILTPAIIIGAGYVFFLCLAGGYIGRIAKTYFRG